MTYPEAQRAIDLILKAKRLIDEGDMASLDDAIEYLRDLEGWAQFHAEEALKEIRDLEYRTNSYLEHRKYA